MLYRAVRRRNLVTAFLGWVGRSHFRQRDRRPRDFVRPGAALCPRLHRADTCARASHQASARFRRCPLPDSTFSARSIRCRIPLHRLRGCSRSFRRSQIAETGMDSGGRSRWKMVGSLRSEIVCSRCSKIKWLVFCEGRFVFKSFFHCSPSPLNHQSPCHGLTQHTSPPLRGSF